MNIYYDSICYYHVIHMYSFVIIHVCIRVLLVSVCVCVCV